MSYHNYITDYRYIESHMNPMLVTNKEVLERGTAEPVEMIKAVSAFGKHEVQGLFDWLYYDCGFRPSGETQ